MAVLILVDCCASHTEPASGFPRVCVRENDFSPSVDASSRLSGPGGLTRRDLMLGDSAAWRGPGRECLILENLGIHMVDVYGVTHEFYFVDRYFILSMFSIAHIGTQPLSICFTSKSRTGIMRVPSSAIAASPSWKVRLSLS